MQPVFTFTLKLSLKKQPNPRLLNSFCLGQVGRFKRMFRGRLSYSLCDDYDQLLLNCHIIHFTDYAKNTEHLTFTLLNLMVNSFVYFRLRKDVMTYALMAPYLEAYLPEEEIPLLCKILEYGTEEIRPLNLFTKTFHRFNEKVDELYNMTE